MSAKLIFCVLTTVVCSKIINSLNLNLNDSCTIQNRKGVCKEYKDCDMDKSNANNQMKCKPGIPLVVCCLEELTTKRTIAEVFDQTSACPPINELYLKIKKDGRGKTRDKCIEWLDHITCVDGVQLLGMPAYKIRNYECKRSVKPLITGGEEASMHEFPHQALLGYNPEPTVVVWRCGGSLISDQWILTAGHCTWNRNLGYVTKVKLGIHAMNDSRPEKVYDVAEVVKHPNYMGNSHYNDIALVKLSKKVTLSLEMIPACLDFVGVEPENAIASGWGNTEIGEQSNVLMKVTLNTFPNDECRNEIGTTKRLRNGVENISQICYGSRDSIKDTCQGDSGGPLQVNYPEVYCTYNVFGVTSFGIGCGSENVPGVYTRVNNYLKWIEDTVWS